MYRCTLLIFIFTTVSLPVFANPSVAAPAKYILQVSSNLSCETLNIELVSEQGDTHKHLSFKSGAFALVELPSGVYSFNDVICENESESQRLDFLRNKIAPLQLKAGQAYYGGRMIFKQVTGDKEKVINNCTRINSRARGGQDGECYASSDQNSAASAPRDISVYAPEQSKEDIAAVRAALGVTKEQLIHLPLKV